ncbi:uncharacterized protein LOC128553580 [Mercenaria mercenaria]|uniref:uncharacterized protein LOC128553580 n=1 Tax=Mercenaria mercenaria TaxID=6596 RepID=UPI00234F78A1|nr:uncharacterized protein LOC128553580 [Mercenaria mercenaria]
MNVNLQNMALEVFNVCASNGISLEPTWISRDKNITADELSRLLDYDDYGYLFETNRWNDVKIQASHFNTDLFSAVQQVCMRGKEPSTTRSYFQAFKKFRECLHSFRSGGASTSANNNTSERLWQRHGRWKSSAARDGLPVFQAPICLISNSEDGKLQVEPEPLKQIQQIDVPLVVVAIAGLYRTGKSYLLNRLAGSSSGFPLGKTIESKTKGIWVWCRKHQEKPNTVLLLLDTEGLGDVAKGDSGHDNRIFTVVTLLSSVLVYNMMSVFNQDAVEKLTNPLEFLFLVNV